MAISKADGYRARVFTVEYDLDGMMKAYGKQFLIALMSQIELGKIDCRQDVNRWAADFSLYGDNFDAHADNYFIPEQHDAHVIAHNKAKDRLVKRISKLTTDVAKQRVRKSRASKELEIIEQIDKLVA